MCDRKIPSSDPHDWDELVAEATAAERYSRRLSERITDGYAAKFDVRADPGGHAALGFRRSTEPPHVLEIDPATIGTAVGLIARYALGTVSSAQLAGERPGDRRPGGRTRRCPTSCGRGSRTSDARRPRVGDLGIAAG
jgi:hypothetical protein